MDSEALVTFLTVHRSGGFSNAAEKLRRSQPAISMRIGLLEEALGLPLFERTAGGVVLSQAGRVLLPHAERVLAALHDAAAAVEALRSGNAGPVSIVAVGTLASTNLTAVLKRFTKECPEVDLTLRTATSAEVSDVVRRGEAAIGLRYSHDASPDLRCEPLGTERLVVACQPRHALAGKSRATLADLRAERWFAFPIVQGQPGGIEQGILAQFGLRGVAEIHWTPVDSLTAQKRLIEAGFGIALLPLSSFREELRMKTLATIRIRDLKAGNPIFSVTRKDGYLSVASLRLLEILKSDWKLGE